VTEAIEQDILRAKDVEMRTLDGKQSTDALIPFVNGQIIDEAIALDVRETAGNVVVSITARKMSTMSPAEVFPVAAGQTAELKLQWMGSGHHASPSALCLDIHTSTEVVDGAVRSRVVATFEADAPLEWSIL